MKIQAQPAILSLLFLVMAANGDSDKDVVTERALETRSVGSGPTLFEKIPSSQSGVPVRYEFDPEHPLKRLYAYGWATGNVAIGDLNGDGRADLFFPGTTGPHRLFLQKGDFQFEEATVTAQLGGEKGWGSCAVLGDVDQDGDLDIYVANFDSPNQLLMNIGRGGLARFVDMAEEYGVDISTGSLGASFVDFDNDGHLDLYLQTYHLEPENGRPDAIETEVEQNEVLLPEEWNDSYLGYLDSEGKPDWVEAPLADRFYRNTGNGNFFLEPGSNLGRLRSYTVSHSWWDFDHNLRPDLYVGNDSHIPDLLLRKSSSAEFGGVSTLALPYTPWYSRGGIAGDFNNDLLIDFLATGSTPLTHKGRLAYGEPFRPDIARVSSTGGAMQTSQNTLFGNTGTNRFLELARLAGIAHTGATWAVKSGDYDGDGWLDLFFATGEARDWTSLPSSDLIGDALQGKTRWDILESQPERREQDLAFRNEQDWQFRDVSREWGLDFKGISYAAGQGDLDGDGDLDLVVCPLGEEVILYRNQSDTNRIVIDLEGTQTNLMGIGAELLFEIEGRKGLRQLYPSGGFKNSDEAAFFLGMGTSATIDRLSIRWPASEAITTLENLKAGNRYSIKEARSAIQPVVRAIPAKPLFAGSNALAGTGYIEPEFNDYTVQPFLPPGVSRTGPSLAAIDLDLDGLAELFFGGSRGIAGNLIARSTKLSTVAKSLVEDSDKVDAGAVFFDSDNDGNPDLFVGRGAVESGTSVSLSKDRLYLGSGQGFQPTPLQTIPGAEANTGPVAAVDFDRDGDVDIFAGARFAVGSYPEPGKSRLLENDGKGSYSNVTSQRAEGLENAGPISSALWSDVNDDGWIDLLVATQWGPVQLWQNNKGTLQERTEESGLAAFTGLWNGITGGDIDNDGDIDYLVTNEGLNSAIEASPSQPAQLFRADFLSVGTPQLIEAVNENGRLFPRLGWLDLAELQPDLLKQYSSPGEFVKKGLPKIFSAEAFAAASSRSVTTLETGIFINDGKGNFTFDPLPRIAQSSTAYGAVFADVNVDGFADIYLVQNRASASIRRPDPENAGISQLLMNTGGEKNRFEAVPSDRSGLVLFGAGRGLIKTDLNNDNRVDFVASLRNGDPAVFVNQTNPALTQGIKVQLGASGKHPAGARVTFTVKGSPTQVGEYYAGGGYLSQSSPELFFSAPRNPEESAVVSIRWADGTTTNRKIYFQ